MEREYAKPLTIFAKALSSMYDWVLYTPLVGFVQDAPRKDKQIYLFIYLLIFLFI